MISSPASYLVRPGMRVTGEIRVPGDKSISHRAALLGAMSSGVTEISGFLEGGDCLATLAALGALGVHVDRREGGDVAIHGTGPAALHCAASALDVGNSGTAMRLLAGMLCGQAFDSTLVGDQSLMRRPMERVAAPLRLMGADVRTRDGRPPIEITGGRKLRGCDHVLELPSAQVKSAILLAGLQAEGVTTVREPTPSRDHTERMLQAFGVAVSHRDRVVAINGPANPSATRIQVPGDFSSAAFFIVAGLIAGAGPLVIRSVGINRTRTALLDILRSMGAQIAVHPSDWPGGEPAGDIVVRPGTLRGVRVPPEFVAIAIDELPILFAAAAVAEGETIVSGAGELRVKESDRLMVMAEGLSALGVIVEVMPDGLRIQGGTVAGGTVESRGDHRVAMSFSVLGACARAPVIVRDVANVGTSFPGFAGLARGVGLDLEEFQCPGSTGRRSTV